MHNRAEFWTPVPDWQSARCDREDVRVTAVPDLKQILIISGDAGAFLSRRGLTGGLGPRDVATGASYVLTLAPDRLLSASETSAPADLGWTDAGYAATDMSDGIVAIDISGPRALDLVQQGTSYDFTPRERRVGESVNIVFAGLRVAIVGRAEGGYRLHVERPYATALWTWLVQVSGPEG